MLLLQVLAAKGELESESVGTVYLIPASVRTHCWLALRLAGWLVALRPAVLCCLAV